jgi:hypothetical protein
VLAVRFARGARYLKGESLKVVWAEFSTLKLGRVVILCVVSAWHDMQPLLELKTQPRDHPVG